MYRFGDLIFGTGIDNATSHWVCPVVRYHLAGREYSTCYTAPPPTLMVFCFLPVWRSPRNSHLHHPRSSPTD
eukprot:1569367-Rhodomonas_salina.10